MVATLLARGWTDILRDVKNWKRYKRILAALVCALACVQALLMPVRNAVAQDDPTPPPVASDAPAATPTPMETLMPARVSQYPENLETLEKRLVDEEIRFFEIQQDVSAGLYSYEDLTRFYLDRIEQSSSSGAVITTLGDSALALAQACDRLPGNGSPLYGIPFIVLDNIDVAGAPTTGGAYLLRDRVPEQDAFLIRMLTVQGAIPIAKANLDELNGLVIRYGEKVPHGSALGGVPVSPYVSRYDVGGTSFGAAMSVALNLAPFAVGTDTVGDVLKSARCNSVVGVRPSHALVSRTGTIPNHPAFDVAVPFAKTVSEAAYVLYAMQGSDIDDPYQQSGAYTPVDDPTELAPASTAGALDGMRILLGTDSELLPAEFTNALVLAGAQLVSNLSYDPYVEDPAMERLSNMSYLYGVRDSVNTFLSDASVEHVANILQLLRYNEQTESAIPYGQDRLNELSLLAPMRYLSVATVDSYVQEHSLDQFMKENAIDLILTGNAALAKYDDTPLNPSVSIPLGSYKAEGETALLSGVLTARGGADTLLIRTAMLLESTLGSLRVKP